MKIRTFYDKIDFSVCENLITAIMMKRRGYYIKTTRANTVHCHDVAFFTFKKRAML